MTREQEYNAAYAKAMAAADCASSVRNAPLFGTNIKDAQAYRDEVKRISDDLTWDAEDAAGAAEILRRPY